MYDTFNEDHQVIIKDHSSQLQELISTKSGYLLDELVHRRVITAAHKDDIMVSVSGSYPLFSPTFENTTIQCAAFTMTILLPLATSVLLVSQSSCTHGLLVHMAFLTLDKLFNSSSFIT